MSEFLSGLFILAVFALILGGVVYLYVTRDRSRAGKESAKGAAPPRAAVKEAEKLSGSYRLSDLAGILERFGEIGAWGMVLEIRFTTIPDDIQMIVNRNEVELCTPILEPEYTDRFRRAAAAVGLQTRAGYTEGQYCVDLTGPWPKIASAVRSMAGSIYGVGDGEQVQVSVF